MVQPLESSCQQEDVINAAGLEQFRRNRSLRHSYGKFSVEGGRPIEEVPVAERFRAAVLGTESSGELPLPKADLRGPTILLVGNEAGGMSSGFRQLCTQVISIPMPGSAHSLNMWPSPPRSFSARPPVSAPATPPGA